MQRFPRLAAFSIALTLAAATAIAAEKSSFILLNNGRPIGKASYMVDATKDGYRVHSTYGIGDSQWGSELKIDANGNFVSGYTQDSQSTSLTTIQPNKQRTQLTIVKGGTNPETTVLDLTRPDFIVVPNFDPGAIQMLLTIALAHPHADAVYTLIVPKADNPQNNVSLRPAPAANGTLAGKPIALTHFHMIYLKGTAELFADETGTLMEADMDILHTVYVRAGFSITHP